MFSGIYECQISTNPVRSLQFQLNISGQSKPKRIQDYGKGSCREHKGLQSW